MTMARALWKGSISFGLVNIPVGLYSAEDRDEGVSFTQLDRRTMSPIGYRRYNKSTNEEVPWDEIVRGYEYERGQYVVLADDDFERANPKASRTVEILDFVDADEIEPMYFDKPYYLAPAGAAKGYALLRETLRRTGKVGIARVVIRTREYLGAVIARGPVMLLEILRYPYEIRSSEDLEVPAEDLAAMGVTEKELKMAERLVEEMVEPWQPSKYKDHYRDDLMARIQEKIRAGETETVVEAAAEEEEAATDVVDIMSLLKRSVERVGKDKDAKEPEKPAVRAKSERVEEEPAEPASTRKRSAPSRSRSRRTA
jgi:DNA end-binding protein Ku